LYFGTLGIIGLSSEEGLHSRFVADHLNFIIPLRQSILWATQQLLNLCELANERHDSMTIGLEGGSAVRIVYSCLGYGVMSFWAAFVFANAGRIKRKALWLISGLCLLWALNVLRIFLLLIAINRDLLVSLPVDHHTIFNVVAYAFIFLLIYFYDRSQTKNVD
jgi:exosortase/archaeosortase family protein